MEWISEGLIEGLGITTLILFIAAGTIAFLHEKKINIVPFRLHPWIAVVAVAVAIIHATFVIIWSSEEKKDTTSATTTTSSSSTTVATRDDIIARFKDLVPRQWGLDSDGVKTTLNAVEASPSAQEATGGLSVSPSAKSDKKIALTFDACGGSGGDGYDKELIDYLIAEKVPATLFINSRWIDANPAIFRELANNPLFTIANHGTLHLPCSVNGREAYGIKGTDSVGAVYDEINDNAQKILELTGSRPKYFRAGTAYTDEICPQIAEALKEKVVNFSINSDAGATNSAEQVKIQLNNAKGGEVVIAHMNHPEGQTAEGYKLAVPELKAAGFEFVRLD